MSIKGPPHPASLLLPEQTEGEQQNTPPVVQVREPWRFRILAVAFAVLTVFVLLRLLDYQLLSAGESVWRQTIPAERMPRGTVVDRNGELLAFDRFFTELSADPSVLERADIDAIADALVDLAGLDRSEIVQALTAQPTAKYALIAKDLDQTVGQAILDIRARSEAADTASPFLRVTVRFTPERFYPQGKLACHVLGIVGIDQSDDFKVRGYYGTEGYYNSFLWQDGVNLQGRGFTKVSDLATDQRRYLPSVSGKDLVLTIDRTIQWMAEEELKLALKTYRAESGSIIVMDPKTGAILAMANAPEFDPNHYGDAEPGAFNNVAVSAQYEPGSIFKIISFGAAVDKGILEPSTVYTDTGRITLGQRVFFNSNRSAVGRTTAARCAGTVAQRGDRPDRRAAWRGGFLCLCAPLRLRRTDRSRPLRRGRGPGQDSPSCALGASPTWAPIASVRAWPSRRCRW